MDISVMVEEYGMARLEQRPRRCRIASAGFTLVEILVAVSVIGVLLGLLLPALAVARLKGEKAVCQSRLGQIGLMTSMFAADHDGLWPVETRLLKEKKPISDEWGYVVEVYTPSSIIYNWAGLLRSYTSDYQGPEPIPLGPGPHTRRGDVRKAMETFACPAAFRWYYREYMHIKLGSPFSTSYYSFRYSPALYTRPSAWRLDAAPVDVYDAFSPQRVDAVTQPSGKSVLVERSTWHQRKHEHMVFEGPTYPPIPRPHASHNVLAADLHVEEKLQSQARPPVTFRGKYVYKNGAKAPLLASEHGVRGRDW